MANQRKSTTNKNIGERDPKKDKLFNTLARILEQAKISVRREKLKQGPGWRAQSGGCLKNGSEQIIFVDSRLAQDEQIAFLESRIVQLGVKIPQEMLGALPDALRDRLTATVS